MKIAQIVCQFRPYKSGMSEVAYHFSKELAKHSEEVVVFTPLYKKELSITEEIDGFKIKRIKPLLKYGNAAFISAIVKELNNFDIVHLHYPFFGAAELIWIKTALTKKKFQFIITYHMDIVGQGIFKLLFSIHSKFIMPHILKSADKITFSSMDYYENSNAKNIKLTPEKIIELPFGIDETLYQPMDKDKEIMRKYNIEDDDKIILMIGGLDKAHYFKGLEYLIKALKLVFDAGGGKEWKKRNLKLIIIGEGNQKRYYENIVEQLGLKEQVIFTGLVDDKEKIKLLNLCSMEVLPSIDKSEVFGIVLLEAMACAKPVIASNLAGVRAVVEDEINGFLCEPKNEFDLAGKIKYLLDNPLAARQMGGNGLFKVQKKYTWKVIGKELVKIYY